jgi:ABC-type multidrug transport system ATPase subunit
MYKILAKELSKTYGSKTVLDNTSFTVEKGHKVSITGISGRGKTTLLRIIAGIVPPDKGNISFDGEVFNWQSAKHIRKQIAYLPQGVELMADNGKELAVLLAIDAESAVAIMQELKLERAALFQSFADLSGGEKQRLLLSLILSLNRPILLLDEPTSALDMKSTEVLMDLIWGREDLTVVSTSHSTLWNSKCHKIIEL